MSSSFETVRTAESAGRNRALRESAAEFLLFLSPQTSLSDEAAAQLAQTAAEADEKTAVLACRVLPFGPDWHADPVTLLADRVDFDGVLARRRALLAAGGFDPALQGRAAEADLCWRLRGLGFSLRYCPGIAARRTAEESVTLEAYAADVRSAFALRAKYGAFSRGFSLWQATLRAPRHFDGVRRKLLAAAPKSVLTALRKRFFPARPSARALADLDEGFGVLRGRCAMQPFSQTPLVSVVVRTCNRPDTLRETLRCLRHQTYRHFEVLVVEDGAPTAKTMLEREFSDLPLRYFPTGEHVGRGRAGNIGIEQAKGEFVSFLDDDDFYYPDFIEQHLAKLLGPQKPGFVISSIMAFETEVKSRVPYIFSVAKRYPVIFDHITLMDMCVRCRIPMTGGMFRRSLYAECGGMREDLGGDEDWAMWLRFWKVTHRAATVPDIPRAVSMFGYPADRKAAAERLAAYEKFDEILLADPNLCFDCTAAEQQNWRDTMAADIAHLRQTCGLNALLAEAEKHEAADLPAKDGVRTAREINRLYWYLVRREGGCVHG